MIALRLLEAPHSVVRSAFLSLQIDEAPIESIVTSNGELRIYTGTAGIELSIYVNSQYITVTVTRSGQVKVTLPSDYGGKINGLCGNFDGSADNDLMTLVGTDVSGETPAVQGQLIAQSYLVLTA